MMLQSYEQDLQHNITQIESDLQNITDAKMNLRKVIDCSRYDISSRSDIFKRYDELCENKVILTNVLDDLNIKLQIVKAEIARCTKRSEL